MSFAAGFYNFTIDLTHTDRGIFTHFRVKTPRHPFESLEHLFARMIAYSHCYRVGQTFSHGLFEPKEPTIWHKDVTGEILLWVNVGAPDKKKIEATLRAQPLAEHRVYFYAPGQVYDFCHGLRGSKTNWVKDVQFYLIPSSILQELVPLEDSSPVWSVTIVDNQLYLSCDGIELEGEIAPIDIWQAYQESLSSDHSPPLNLSSKT